MEGGKRVDRFGECNLYPQNPVVPRTGPVRRMHRRGLPLLAAREDASDLAANRVQMIHIRPALFFPGFRPAFSLVPRSPLPDRRSLRALS